MTCEEQRQTETFLDLPDLKKHRTGRSFCTCSWLCGPFTNTSSCGLLLEESYCAFFIIVKNKSGLGLQHLQDCGNKTESHLNLTLGYSQKVRINCQNEMQILGGQVWFQHNSSARAEKAAAVGQTLELSSYVTAQCVSVFSSEDQQGLCTRLHLQTVCGSHSGVLS